MVLSQDETKLFFGIWLRLLAFINEKYQISSEFGRPKIPAGINPTDILPIRDKLWEDDSLIDEYIESRWDIPRNETLILKGWKARKHGKYFILKHLKKYSVFLDENDNLFGVVGISGPISEMFPAEVLPLMVNAVLLPFADKIIYDSLLMPYNVHFGGGIRKELADTYRTVKNERGIQISIP